MFHTIETTRLRLRPIKDTDIDAMHAQWLEPEVLRYLCDGEQIPRSRMEEIVAASDALFTDHDCGFWCVEDKATRHLLGFAAFWFFHEPPVLELMYGLSAKHWGHGYATEAARALVHYGFEHLGLERIDTSTDVPNTASAKVMERAGFRFDHRTDEGLWGMLHYVLERADDARPFEPITVSSL